MKKTVYFLLLLLAFLLTTESLLQAQAVQDKPLEFTTHTIKTGPLTLHWESMPVIDAHEIYTAKYFVASEAEKAIPCKISIRSIDTITGIEKGQEVKTVSFDAEIPAKGKKSFEYQFKPLPGTFTAHYPLNLYVDFEWNGKKMTANAVRVIETKFPSLPKKTDSSDKNIIIKNGGVSLIEKSHTAYYVLKDKPIVFLGENWTGSDKSSRASLAIGNYIAGTSRKAFGGHVPYIPLGGSLFLDYKLRLPKKDKITLDYGCATRMISAEEPPSDGVTFRIWGKLQGGEKKILSELHTAEKIWVDRTADLSAYAGKEMILTVEFNPGPKNNTVCDGFYMSGLLINARNSNELAVIKTESAKKSYEFKLADNWTATVIPGDKGLLDAKYSLKNTKSDKELAFEGIRLSVDSSSLTDNFAFAKKSAIREDRRNGKITQRITLLINDEPITVTICAYEKNGLFIMEIPEGNPARIGNFMINPMNSPAQRVYFGHGYVVENPKDTFIAGGGGHNLSTSHIGFDFENGCSLLMASEMPPAALVVQPDQRIYSLQISGPTRLALVPSDKGAFDSAIKYRKNCPWYSAPSKGVARKRGRLTFDVWGGTYADNAKNVEKAFEYGVTDSLFVKHCWQRWGYDVRLPDIWEENSDTKVLPSLGSYDDLVKLTDTCVNHNVPFGYHDNYIDFYPDAKDFSYDYITFHENGQPRKAWINHGMGVQSYQWRPDKFKPFLERNLAITKKLLPKMDACFVDVFLSANIFDYQSIDGKFHPRKETQHYWKDCFETIGSTLAHKNSKGELETAITMSEASSDFLIGSIDGGDAQWLALSQKGRAWSMRFPCENWARTPWFAAVNHTNFSRHGAGYPDRYLSLRNYGLHGIMSDDYIGAEILGGLDLMVAQSDVFPNSVRKHYLAQHVVRAHADKEITDLKFANENGKDNIFRQTVSWSDGSKVYANRGLGNWKICEGITLPYYGYYVTDKTGQGISGIICNPNNDKEIVEFSKRPDSFYVNGRGFDQTKIWPVTPKLAGSKDLGDGKFTIDVEWTADAPFPSNLTLFVHVFEAYRGYGHNQKGWYSIAESPKVPTSKWGTNGNKIIHSFTDQIITVPNEITSGRYQILVGIYNSKSGNRYQLMGEGGQQTRYAVADLLVKRSNGKTSVEITPIQMEEARETFFRLMANKSEYCFNGVSTPGAVAVTPATNAWTILPIPVAENFDVSLNENIIGKKVAAISCNGKNVPFKTINGKIVFSVLAKEAAKYIVNFK